MKANLLCTAVASALLGWAGVSFAQTSYGSGESARCESMSGVQKEQCLRDEANKTQGAPADAASSGATREAATPGEKYEKNAGSPHCDQMTGAEKEKCLDAEARKDGNPAPSKTGD
jgi:hypothetical protein